MLNPSFTDHAVITCYTTFKTSGQNVIPEKSYLCDTGQRYGNLDFNNAPWPEVRQQLSDIDWSDMMAVVKKDPKAALEQFHDKVLNVLEKTVPARKAKSKYKMSKERKQLWTRISKVTYRLVGPPQ